MEYRAQNRLSFDPCEYRQELKQATEPLAYMLYPAKYNSPKQVRHQLGLVGGDGVSLIRGNLVDLESDLQGITRSAGRCDVDKYAPACDMVQHDCQPRSLAFQERSSGATRSINTTLGHRPAAQFWGYSAVPQPAPMGVAACNMARF